MGRLKIVVLYDRVLMDESDEAAAGDKSPVVRTLDKKEVEEEVADALTKLGHEPVMYEIDGTIKISLILPSRIASPQDVPSGVDVIPVKMRAAGQVVLDDQHAGVELLADLQHERSEGLALALRYSRSRFVEAQHPRF